MAKTMTLSEKVSNGFAISRVTRTSHNHERRNKHKRYRTEETPLGQATVLINDSADNRNHKEHRLVSTIENFK